MTNQSQPPNMVTKTWYFLKGRDYSFLLTIGEISDELQRLNHKKVHGFCSGYSPESLVLR